MASREEHIEQARKVFNHIGILYDTDIVRCVGFAEDDDDYYWVINGHDKLVYGRGKLAYCSKVGAFISLKDLNYPRYDYLEKMMHEYWGAPRAEKFEVKWIGDKRNLL